MTKYLTKYLGATPQSDARGRRRRRRRRATRGATTTTTTTTTTVARAGARARADAPTSRARDANRATPGSNRRGAMAREDARGRVGAAAASSGRAGTNARDGAEARGTATLTVDVETAETEAEARERVRFFELCAPSALGTWTDERTCVVDVRGGIAALQGTGAELIAYLRDRLGVIMEVDAERERVLINHEIHNVVIEAARILHLQIEQAKMVTIAPTNGDEAATPTPKMGLSSSVDDDAVMQEVLGDIEPEELEELRRQLESKRATRQRLIETLGEPRVTCHLQPVELTSTLVRVRLPRTRSFTGDDPLYGVGVALRAVASTTQDGEPTWIFQCDMGGSKLHETDIMYISNNAISVPEVCRLVSGHKRRSVDKPRDVMDEFLPSCRTDVTQSSAA